MLSQSTAVSYLRRLGRLAFSLAALGAMAPTPARAALHVVTTVEGLAALAREVAGDRATVESLSRGVADPHYVDANPMLAVKLRNADLLVDVGLELEIGWLPPLVNQRSPQDCCMTPSKTLPRPVRKSRAMFRRSGCAYRRGRHQD